MKIGNIIIPLLVIPASKGKFRDNKIEIVIFRYPQKDIADNVTHKNTVKSNIYVPLLVMHAAKGNCHEYDRDCHLQVSQKDY